MARHSEYGTWFGVLIMLGLLLAQMAITVGIVYAAVHFITKFW